MSFFRPKAGATRRLVLCAKVYLRILRGVKLRLRRGLYTEIAVRYRSNFARKSRLGTSAW